MAGASSVTVILSPFTVAVMPSGMGWPQHGHIFSCGEQAEAITLTSRPLCRSLCACSIWAFVMPAGSNPCTSRRWSAMNCSL